MHGGIPVVSDGEHALVLASALFVDVIRYLAPHGLEHLLDLRILICAYPRKDSLMRSSGC
jgi:hypothetical protein